MQIEKRTSYGIIPIYRNKDGSLEFFVVRQTQLGQTYWSFAKGTPEAEETPLETALRETKEEVGIEFADVDETVSFSEQYSFLHNGVPVEKTTTYFLGFATDKRFALQEDEIEVGEWLNADEVRKRLTYSETKRVFEEVIRALV